MLRSSRVVAGLPPEVEDVFEEFRTCELSALARDPDYVAHVVLLALR